ncbi:MAG TPA: DUF1800 domain-containing protein [Vicinamibacterales bacterium]|nr:DUF1800 domain-containing protein [Vicinamibacterales bacterium]
MTFRTLRTPRLIPATAAATVLFSLLVSPLGAQKDSAVPAKADARTVAHVLDRIGFGPRPGDIERVQQQGLAAYIDAQLHPEKIADAAMSTRLDEFATLKMSSRELADKYFVPALELRRDAQIKQQKAANKEAKSGSDSSQTMSADENKDPKPAVQPLPPEVRQVQQAQANVNNELMQAKLLREIGSDKQLEEVLTDFWFNHFNVFLGKGQVRQYLTEYERDVIRPHVLGNFRDLLGATAHSPAMLFYLDNWQSSTPNAPALLTPEMQRRLNSPRVTPSQKQQLMSRLEQAKKQAPKGLNENYARELMELHTLGVNGGYTQKDVQEVARAFTGWTIDRPQQSGGFIFRPQMHDTGEKTILGVQFKAGGGQDEGERVLDMLAKSPQTAHHISYELAQRFVADEPPASLVDRAAKRFLDTKGDLREVVRTIVTSPEFFADDAYRAKVKTPLEFVVSAVRATGATVVNAQPLVGQLRNLGMPLYGCVPPTGYSMTADAWVNTGSLLSRMNFALQLVSGQIQPGPPGPRGQGAPPPPRPNQLALQRNLGRGGPGRGPIQIELASLAPDTSAQSRTNLVDSMLAGRASDATQKTLARAETPQQLVALTLGSPEFQRR